MREWGENMREGKIGESEELERKEDVGEGDKGEMWKGRREERETV